MPDLITAGATASAKPLVKLVLKHRPGALKKKAQEAEYEVTKLLQQNTTYMSQRQFDMVQAHRNTVSANRKEAEAASWLRHGPYYLRIVYTYYESARLCLEVVKDLTDKAARTNGPEGLCNASSSRTGQPQAATRVVMYTLDNVLLQPGINTIEVPFPNESAELCSVKIRTKSTMSPVNPNECAHETGHGNEDREDAVSVTVSIEPDDDVGEPDADSDSGDASGDGLNVSFRMPNLAARASRHGRPGSGPNFEVDLSDLWNEDI